MSCKNNRECCSICKNKIYLHDIALICNIDDTIYHSTCLKISNFCAYSLIAQGDWCCPKCPRQMFPFYEYDILKEQEENRSYYCTCCGKIISRLCHTKLCCSTCDKYMHKECSKANLCGVCYSAAIDDSGSDVNAFIKQEFNPFANIVQTENDDYNNSDYMISIANDVLNSCHITSIDEYVNDLSCNHADARTSLFSLNINGFKTNFLEFVATYNLLNNGKKSFDFYCFCEINLKHDEPNEFVLPGYLNISLPAIKNKRKGSGLSIFFNSNLTFAEAKSLTPRNRFFETLSGKLKTPVGIYQIIVSYRFHNQDFSGYINSFMSFIDSISDKPTIICGDFNVDMFLNETCTNSNDFLNNFMEKGFIPLISKTTRVSKSTQTCIDGIWVNFYDDKLQSRILDSSISDHFPIITTLPSPAGFINKEYEPENEPEMSTYTNINENTTSKFMHDLTNFTNGLYINNETVFDKNIAKKNFDYFYNSFKGIYCKAFAISKTKDNRCKKRDPFF